MLADYAAAASPGRKPPFPFLFAICNITLKSLADYCDAPYIVVGQPLQYSSKSAARRKCRKEIIATDDAKPPIYASRRISAYIKMKFHDGLMPLLITIIRNTITAGSVAA